MSERLISIAVLLSFLFFIPLAPLVGALLGIILLLSQGENERYFGKLSVAVGIFFCLLQAYLFFIVVPDMAERTILLRVDMSSMFGNPNYSPHEEFTAADFSDVRIIQGQSIRLIPLKPYKDDLPLKDLCLLLKSKFMMGCSVEPMLDLELDDPTGQYHASQIFERSRLMGDDFYIMITDKDITEDEYSFLFGYREGRKGVVSTYRFRTLSSDTVLARQIGIQLISTTGQMFGLERPTDPRCALAYPNSIQEFGRKTSDLCENAEDIAMFWSGGEWMMLQASESEREEFARVYNTYGFI